MFDHEPNDRQNNLYDNSLKNMDKIMDNLSWE
jgi:hypothetical protein